MARQVDRRSWGRLPYDPPSDVVQPASRSHLLSLRPDLTYLPYGNGRSYGDSCLNSGGGLIRTHWLDRFIEWDGQKGVLRCESGMLLSEVLNFALPRGWFLPVTPGTKFVTLGGAIANDVHGKNHHEAGSFGHHIERFDLLRTDTGLASVSREADPERFAATIGGLGLTGLITTATMRLKAVPGPWLEQRVERFRSLDEFFAIDERLRSLHEYTVAWVDCLASGQQAGRGIYMAANHVDSPRRGRAPRRKASLPFEPPISLVSHAAVQAFNWAYYHWPRAEGPARIHYERFFYPLDGIQAWNRIYGPRGFFQFQCVVPPEASRDAMSQILRQVSARRTGSFLAVLKTFGHRPAEGYLSFSRPGTTLALDFPSVGQPTLQLLAELERIVVSCRGAIYPAKDAAMSASAFAIGFPRWSQMRSHLDPRFSSRFARRVGLL